MIALEPRVHRDERGFFLETFRAERFEGLGLPARFVQTNHSRSRRGTVRGLHTQVTRPQGKLVRVARGAIFDVAVDVREGSETFGRWVGVVLDDERLRQLWIPPGFAHGFAVLSEVADVEYACTEIYRPDDEIAIRWDDPAIGIDWPLDRPILSPRDASAPTLAECAGRLPALAP